jgi:hypothetical protein
MMLEDIENVYKAQNYFSECNIAHLLTLKLAVFTMHYHTPFPQSTKVHYE